MQLIIGNQNYSTWSMRPWLYIEFHALPVEIRKMTLFSESLVGELDQHFSNRKVPLLLDGDTEVWDSLAILEYLAERFPAVSGWPEDAQARAVARAVSAEMHSSFAALRNELPMNCRKFYPDMQLSDAARRDVERIMAIWRYCRSRFADGGPWLFGRFSIADAMYAPVVMRFRSVDVELTDDACAYCDTMNACASVTKWIAAALAEQDVVEQDELEGRFELLTG